MKISLNLPDGDQAMHKVLQLHPRSQDMAPLVGSTTSGTVLKKDFSNLLTNAKQQGRELTL